MKINCVTLSLDELQDALRHYCLQREIATSPDEVVIESHGKPVLNVELKDQGLVTGMEFKHRVLPS